MTLPTKTRFRKQVREWTGWVAAALLGAGVALSISIIFLAPGVVLLGLGLAAIVLGVVVGELVPFLLPHRSLACPYCRHSNEVFNGSGAFLCDNCFRPVKLAEALPVPRAILDEAAVYSIGRRMLIAFTALSFVAFLVEMYLGHYARVQLYLQQGTFSPALVPIAFSPIGMVVSLLALIRLTPGVVKFFNGVMLVSIAIGMGGTYFHIASRITSLGALVSVSTWLGDPPALAPFAFALPGIMGLVATYGLHWVERVPTATTYQAFNAEAPAKR